MQLFSRQESNNTFTKKRDLDITQAAYLETTLKKLQERINTENTKFEENLANQRKVYSEEKLTLQGQIKALENELETKRQERVALMIPIDTLKKDAEETLREVNKRLVEIDEKESELQDLINLTTEKLDKIGEREQKCADWELSLKIKQLGVDAESEQVSDGHARLNTQMHNFYTEVETKSKELAEKEKALEIGTIKIKEYLELRTKELDNEKRALADKRGALEREFARLQNNKK